MLLLAVILLAAINYQNNMVFALVFLLASVFVVTILHTYANLSGLSITAVNAFPAFAGEPARFDIKVSRSNQRSYYDIGLSWPESEVCTVSLDTQQQITISLHLPAVRRGLLTPPRLLVETFFPLGLVRSWTWLALNIDAVIYPQPVARELRVADGLAGDEGEANTVAGSDDFYAFKNYQPGDLLKHIAWKSFAKGQDLQTKQFASFRDQQFWLDWACFNGDTETRLSAICFWVLKLEKRGEDYGVRLPGISIDPGQGQAHRDRVLKELALFAIDKRV